MMLLHNAVKNLPLSVKREHSRLSCSLQGETLTQCFILKKRLNTTLRILKKLLQILSTRLHNRPIVPAVFFAAEKLSPNSFEKIRRSCRALRVSLTIEKYRFCHLVRVYLQRCLVCTERYKALSVRTEFSQKTGWLLHIYLKRNRDKREGTSHVRIPG